MTSSKSHYKEKLARRRSVIFTFLLPISKLGFFFSFLKFVTFFQREEKSEELENPKYRDRAKERRENQNPDYDPTELNSFHAVAPPGAVDLR